MLRVRFSKCLDFSVTVADSPGDGSACVGVRQATTVDMTRVRSDARTCTGPGGSGVGHAGGDRESRCHAAGSSSVPVTVRTRSVSAGNNRRPAAR